MRTIDYIRIDQEKVEFLRKPTRVVKGTVVLQKNHLPMKVYNFLPHFHQLLLGTPRDGFSDSILKVLQIDTFMLIQLV